MSNNDELKPCPFCGGIDLTHSDAGVWCNNTKCEGGIDFGHFIGFDEASSAECKAAVAKAWNTRSENPAQAQEIDALKAHVNELREANEAWMAAKFGANGKVKDCQWALIARAVNLQNKLDNKTPAQSLAAHDAAIVKGVMEECSIALANEYLKDATGEADDIVYNNAVTDCRAAIRSVMVTRNVR